MRRRRSRLGKEKIIMLASGALVLTALTVTGLYVRNQNKPVEEEEQIVDFSSLERTVPEKADEIASAQAAEDLDELGELDYAPLLQEANSGKVSNPGLQKKKVRRTLPEKKAEEAAKGEAAEEEAALEPEAGEEVAMLEPEGVVEVDIAAGTAELVEEEIVAEEAVAQAAPAEAAERELHFDENENLVWPIVGNVLLNYSMDKAVYFPTLQQYKYNPAIVIAAVEGDSVTSAAAGKVTSIYEDSATGTTLVMELGDGYEATYGQLKEVAVAEGDHVEKGAILAKVASPTRQYSVEGCNVYFKLCKDGSPVNPMNRLG